MGCLLLLNDNETKSYWRRNIFKLENILLIESISTIILILISNIAFPFNSLKIIKNRKRAKYILIISLIFSFIPLIISLLTRYIHIKNNIKPNYRLCIMHTLVITGNCFIILCLALTLYISSLINNWANIYEFIEYQNIGNIIFIFVLNYINILSLFIQLIDFFMEIIIISKTSKFLSLGNNINNQKLLFELFKINIHSKNSEIKENNNLYGEDKYDENKTFKKLRIIFPNNNEENMKNNFENDINKFREVELIEKVEYKSIAIQTDDNININNKYNLIDEDLSKDIILVKNSQLINSFNSTK